MSKVICSGMPDFSNSSQIGDICVLTDSYFACWRNEEPDVVLIRDPKCRETEWIAYRVGGYCDIFDHGKVESLHPSSVHLLPDGHELNKKYDGVKEQESVDLLFEGRGNPRVLYRYRFTFHSDRIEYALSFEAAESGPILLVATHVGQSVKGRRSFHSIDAIFDSCPPNNGMNLMSPARPLSMRTPWFTPPPFCYPMRLANGSWISASLEPDRSQLQFHRFVTNPSSHGSLAFRIQYKGDPPYTTRYDAPPLVFRFGAKDEYDALRRQAEAVVALGKADKPEREQSDWWNQILICGWIEQERLALKHGGAPADYCHQPVYEEWLKKFDATGVEWDTCIVDDHWSVSLGDWVVDTKTWPDMRGFVDRCHAQGKKVLLWVCVIPWGLPDDEVMIHNGSYNPMKDTLNPLLDPTNPKYLARLKRNLHHMLSGDKGCLDADGIKLDFTGKVPDRGTYTATRMLYGMEYQHEVFQVIHDAAKAAKPDCLLDFQVANPHFAAIHDMTRLNDFFLPTSEASRVMGARAKIAHAGNLGALVDMDGPRHPDYFRTMQEFGTYSLYVTSDDLDRPDWVTAIKAGIAEFRRRKSRA